MNQQSHIIPTSEIQAQNMLAQIVDKFFELKRKRMRFDKRETFDKPALLDFLRKSKLPESQRFSITVVPSISKRLKTKKVLSKWTSGSGIVCRFTRPPSARFWSRNGKVAAALGTSSTILHIDETQLPKIVELVKNSANEVSVQLGFDQNRITK